jgi:hypothetical protein
MMRAPGVDVAGSRASGESVYVLRVNASKRVVTFVVWAN